MPSLFNRPTANVDMHIVSLEDIVRITPAWSTTGLGNPIVEQYHVETVPQGSPIPPLSAVSPGTFKVSELPRVLANPQRLLFLDGEPVATVSVKYVPLQNKTFFDQVEQIIRRAYPNAEVAYFEGASKWQRLGTYLVEKDIEIPFDPAASPDKFDFHIMVTNSMDTTYSINVTGVWSLGSLRLIGNNKVFHHARTGEAQKRLMDSVLGYLERIIVNHKLPTRAFAKLKSEQFEERHVLEIANKIHMTKKEAEVLRQWGFEMDKVEGEYVNLRRIPGSPKSVSTGWDVLLMFSDATRAATSTWREWEACKKVSNVVREVVFG